MILQWRASGHSWYSWEMNWSKKARSLKESSIPWIKNCQIGTSHHSFGISKQHSPSPQPIVTTTTRHVFNNLKVQGLKSKMYNTLSLLSCCPATKSFSLLWLGSCLILPHTLELLLQFIRRIWKTLPPVLFRHGHNYAKCLSDAAVVRAFKLKNPLSARTRITNKQPLWSLTRSFRLH